MMNIFLLISIILCVLFQNILRKTYAQKNSGKGVYFFSLLSSFAAMCFFLIASKGFEWNAGLLGYAFFFALSYAVATVFSVIAVAHGSLSLTTLIISYSLMLPTVYGLLFLKEPIGVGLIPGLALLAISLVLINQPSEDSPITFKWIIYVLLAFAGNGMCSVAQKMQQEAFGGAYKNEFMILALVIVVAVLSILVVKDERKEIKQYTKTGWHLTLICGISNGIMNLFVMLLSGRMPVSIMFPMISAGGIVVTYVVSKYFYKEKLTKKQLIGFVIGIVSIVFLNI